MASGFRNADGTYADGSWELKIKVTDLPIKNAQGETVTEHVIPVLVRSEESIGIAISRLVDTLRQKFNITQDWSDYEIWWPQRTRWLINSKHALVRDGVQADAELWFTKKHKILRLQLPDLQYANVRVDFSARVFTTVKEIARFFDIRHPEELSLLKPILNNKPSHKHASPSKSNGYDDNGLITPNVLTPGMTPTSPYTPGSPMYNTLTPKNRGNSPLSANSLEFLDASFIDPTILTKSRKPSPQALHNLFRPKSLVEKGRRNTGWLDSSKSLMEQGIEENDTLMLRFKFYSFYDLNPKYDSIRINQLYEQARWSLLAEEFDCTEEEMLMFASLQYHICRVSENVTEEMQDDKNKDLDAALQDLEVNLGMGPGTKSDITSVPELADYLKILKPGKLGIKSWKKFWFTFKDTTMSYYKTIEDAASLSSPIQQLSVKGAEVMQDVSMKDNKFIIKLLLPCAEGMKEVCLRCDKDVHYCKWMAACKLAAKGRTMADSSYDTEVQNLRQLLKMQSTGSGGSHDAAANNESGMQIEPEFFVARKHLRKLGNKSVVRKIHERVAYYNKQSLIESKLAYIKAWQALPDFGVTHFSVRFKGSRKEEIAGFAFNRLIRIDPVSGEALKTWRYNTMREWSVNWESKNLIIHVASDESVAFICQKQSPKLVHEFLGGYIFLSMRSKDKEDHLNEELFHRLTGGNLENDPAP